MSEVLGRKEFSKYVIVCMIGTEEVHEVFMLRFENMGAYVGGFLYWYQFLCGCCSFVELERTWVM